MLQAIGMTDLQFHVLDEPIEPIPAFYCCDREYSDITPHFAKKEIVRNQKNFVVLKYHAV